MAARVAVRVAAAAIVVTVVLAAARRMARAAARVDDATCGAAEQQCERGSEKREGNESSKAHGGRLTQEPAKRAPDRGPEPRLVRPISSF